MAKGDHYFLLFSSTIWFTSPVIFCIQASDKFKNEEWPKQDLKSRGLCLVPVLSTFPVAAEIASDFWNPTFGGTIS